MLDGKKQESYCRSLSLISYTNCCSVQLNNQRFVVYLAINIIMTKYIPNIYQIYTQEYIYSTVTFINTSYKYYNYHKCYILNTLI